MTIVYAIVRTLGLPLCIVLALLAYYEGLPFVSDIPFADRIPVIRELVTGRVATERAKAADEARSGYVHLSEKIAAQAEAAKLRRERDAASKALEEHRKRLAVAQASEDHANARLEKEIAENEIALNTRGRKCTADQFDVDWVLKP